MHAMNRRRFLALSAAATGSLFLPVRALARSVRAGEEPEPHFFLQIVLNGGADPTYLWDARPRAMTAAKLLQNYNREDAILHTGLNGGTCLLPESSRAMRPFLDRFSIVNGVVMTPTFDGHDQNMNFYFTGSSTGGQSFLPYLRGGAGFPLDAVQNGRLSASITNHGHVVPLDPATAGLLRDKLARSTPVSPGSELHAYVTERFTLAGTGASRFAQGAAQMLSGFGDAAMLRERLLGIETPDPALADEEKFVGLMGSVFKNRVAGSALWVFPDDFDVHGFDQAQKQPELFATASDRLARVLKALSSTPFDATRSLLDVTTVLVNSEFSRTMRQEDKPIDQTGTDHNQFNNSFLIGGKGIKGGQVIGASDRASAEEELSPVHKAFDAKGLKLMGRAFDFTTQRPTDSPASYDPKSYLTSDSVVNTLYSLFSVARGNFRTIDRDRTVAPTLSTLLS